MTNDDNRISIKISNLDDVGFGVNAKFTRREWQNECYKKIILGANEFNNWLRQIAHNYGSFDLKTTNFDFEIVYPDKQSELIIIDWFSHSDSFTIDLTNFHFDDTFSFQGYEFYTDVLFCGSEFSRVANFRKAVFHKKAYFIGTTFNNCFFHDAKFYSDAIFSYSIFKAPAFFSYSKFLKGAIFQSCDFHLPARFDGSEFRELNFAYSEFFGDVDFSGNLNQTLSFGNASFVGSIFRGRANFGNRKFNGKTDFGFTWGCQTTFEKVPLFHNSELHQDTTFENAIFPREHSKDETDARAYNTLRLAMNKQQFILAEKRFILLQLDAERSISRLPEKLLFSLYKIFSNYGYSVTRPIFWLLFSMFFFAIIYGLILSVGRCDLEKIVFGSCYIDYSLLIKSIKYSFIQSLPPLGIEKLSNVFIKSFYSQLTTTLIIITVIQKVISLIGWFLLVLGIRNLYKLK